MRREPQESLDAACAETVRRAVEHIVADPTASVLLVAGTERLYRRVRTLVEEIRQGVEAAGVPTGACNFSGGSSFVRTGLPGREFSCASVRAGLPLLGIRVSFVVLFHPDFDVCTEAERTAFEDWFGPAVLTRVRSCPLGQAVMFVPK